MSEHETAAGSDRTEACDAGDQQAVSKASPDGDAPSESRRRILGCFLLMLAAVQLTLGPKILLSQWEIQADTNAGVAEGLAWLNGRLDLPPTVRGTLDWNYPPLPADAGNPAHRLHDTAYFEPTGKLYNVFPPMISILTVVLSPLHRFLLGEGADLWLQTPFVLLVFWPLPIVGFIVFRRRTGDSVWAALLTVAWMGGTAVLPALVRARYGWLGGIDHVVSQIGLLILAADILGKQRIWPGLIGLLICTYTRQMTFLYGIPLLWIALRSTRSGSALPRWNVRRFLLCGAGLAVIAAPLLSLNTLKFGHPLDFGYSHIYVGRETDPMGQRCVEHGTFSTHFIRENLYYMHLAPPRIGEITAAGVQISDDNPHSTSLWITTPLAIWVVLAAGCWWREANGRLLMMGSLLVMAGLLCYHSPGFLAPGYCRFSLDFLPIWLLVVAPFTRGRWRTWLTLGCVAWSLLYFQAIVTNDSAVITPTPRKTLTMVDHGGI